MFSSCILYLETINSSKHSRHHHWKDNLYKKIKSWWTKMCSVTETNKHSNRNWGMESVGASHMSDNRQMSVAMQRLVDCRSCGRLPQKHWYCASKYGIALYHTVNLFWKLFQLLTEYWSLYSYRNAIHLYWHKGYYFDRFSDTVNCIWILYAHWKMDVRIAGISVCGTHLWYTKDISFFKICNIISILYVYNVYYIVINSL
jgi:hypothetical protein